MKPYLRWGKMVEFNKNDMQSFTLLRFHIPFLMGFHGKALVIDPDIFQVQEGIEGLINFDFERHSIYARKGLQKKLLGFKRNANFMREFSPLVSRELYKSVASWRN